MPRQWITEPEHEWEHLQGEPPCCQLSVHPSGDYVALQASVWLDTTTERAAIWDTRTKKIVWNPGDVNAMAWVPGGNAILLLREVYCFELRSWPSLDLIGSCPIEPPTGWLTDIVPSPNGSLACVVWEDQCEAGIELVSWESGQPNRLEDHGYFGQSNLIDGPVFSPNGRHIAFTYGNGWWWSDESPETPSEGGSFNAGCVVIGDLDLGAFREIAVTVTVPQGWLPENPGDITNELLGCPTFIDDSTVALELRTGDVRRFSVLAGDDPRSEGKTKAPGRPRGLPP
jgi:hypothetical protein